MVKDSASTPFLKTLEEVFMLGKSVTNIDVAGHKYAVELTPILWRNEVPTLQLQIWDLSKDQPIVVQSTGRALEGVVFSDASKGLQIIVSEEKPLPMKAD